MKQAYESLIYLTKEVLPSEATKTVEEQALLKSRIGSPIGPNVSIRILAEDGVCTLFFEFSYGAFFFVSLVILAAAVLMSLVLFTVIPTIILVAILPLALKVNSDVARFLDNVNETLPRLEQEYAQMALIEERKRWQQEPKDTRVLYGKLREKHVKTWGNTYALEYKIAEYEKQGLTREEAVRKTSEEEGAF